MYQNGNLVAIKLHGTQAGIYYVISDHLGTPQQIVDSAGTVVWKTAYLPFGKAQVLTETITSNIRFPGQYYDAETGLHYNWNRYYDPDTGRYLTPDPIGLTGGLNLYAYVAGNPVNLVDLWGLSALGGVLTGLGADLATPEPTDLAWPKWVGWGTAIGGAVLLDWMMSEGEDDASPPIEKKRPRRFKKKDRDEALEECKDENGEPRCIYCGSKLHTSAGHADSYEADHGTPYSQGGESTKENLYPSCRTCNRSKRGKLLMNG